MRCWVTPMQSVELWNNVGLCCFYAGQYVTRQLIISHSTAHLFSLGFVHLSPADNLFMYDFTLACFERALQLADDQTSADVW
jgi:hypothetical protein